MKPLEGKHILICRSRQKNASFESAFKKHGAKIRFFSTFRTEAFDAMTDEKIASTLQNLPNFDWLVLSSKNGVRAFAENLEALRLTSSILEGLGIGIVGEKTAASFSKSFPQKDIMFVAHSLQDLLDEIRKTQNQHETMRVIHLTSQQSLENISVNPPEGLELLRFPLYQTVIDNSHLRVEIKRVKSGDFDIIVFTSPSSFDHFLELISDDRLITHSNIAVLGNTTKQHIENRGYTVEIVATEPEAEKLADAVVNHYESKQINA